MSLHCAFADPSVYGDCPYTRPALAVAISETDEALQRPAQASGDRAVQVEVDGDVSEHVGGSQAQPARGKQRGLLSTANCQRIMATTHMISGFSRYAGPLTTSGLVAMSSRPRDHADPMPARRHATRDFKPRARKVML